MPAQPPSAPASTLNHNLIVLDPAHGGPDPGATLGDHVLEKDVTLAFALKLRAALAAANFTVATTRDADPSDPLTPDQRAEIANRTHAVACIVLHATSTGSGLHIYTSTLQPSDDADSFASFVPIPWDTAQAASVSQSQRLASDLASAFTKASLPTLSGQAAVRPLDNLMCPAVAIEIAPLLVPGQDPTAVTDAGLPAARHRHPDLRPADLARPRRPASRILPTHSANLSSVPRHRRRQCCRRRQVPRPIRTHHPIGAEGIAMIPRYQRILFWILALASLLMALFLLHGCEQAREKLTRHRDETPLAAPVATASETVHLALADDSDGSITLEDRDVALPEEATARTHALLARLIAEYSYKDSAHPLESGPAIDDVFLLDLPLQPPVAAGKPATQQPDEKPAASDTHHRTPCLPAASWPSSISTAPSPTTTPPASSPRSLTIDSIIGTLYANFPRIEQVRFLVDGHPRDTLNGHADLTRTYPVVNTVNKPAPAQETH